MTTAVAHRPPRSHSHLRSPSHVETPVRRPDAESTRRDQLAYRMTQGFVIIAGAGSASYALLELLFG